MPKTILIAVAFVLGFLAGKLLGSPADEVRAAVADLQANVPQQDWPHTRYLSLANVEEKDRGSFKAVAGFVLNSVGQSPTIIGTGEADGELLRINLASYRIASPAWEAIASDKEPYFHIRTAVIDPRTGKKTIVHTDAGHVGLENAAKLRAMTGSTGAILRADFFVARAFLPPHYYNLAGVPKKLDDFYAMLGVDGKTQLALQATKGASIFDSGVTGKPRRISRWQAPRGAAWVTYDSRADGDILKHPIRVPGFAFKHDASEHIAAKANGLHLYALYDAQGNRQDEVPPDIAHDTTAVGNDQRLRAGMSCIRCHQDGGFRSFENDFAKMVGPGKADLHLPEKEAEYIVAFNDVERTLTLLKRDREDFETAVKRATGGMTSTELSKAIAAVYAKYEHDRVDIETVKRDLGADSIEPLKVTTDPIMLAILSGIPVTRSDWELSFSSAALLMEAAK